MCTKRTESRLGRLIPTYFNMMKERTVQQLDFFSSGISLYNWENELTKKMGADAEKRVT